MNVAIKDRTQELEQRYAKCKELGLKLDMTRGQPSSEQFDLSNPLLSSLGEQEFMSDSGVDCRNYPGGVFGLKEAREYFSKILGVAPEEMLVGNNSSLTVLNDVLRWFMLRGACGVEEPWFGQKVKMICPVPGYDRHFTMCEALGLEMITVPLGVDGPDMAEVESLCASDSSVKGIITVPQYSNPTGITFSDEVVEKFARLKPAAKDFTIFWDNAYAVHDLTPNPERVKNLLACCKEAGCPERPLMFSSTSKITFAGAGLGFMAASETNLEYLGKFFGTQYIGPDKITQLRHLKFFDSYEGGLEGLMKDHLSLMAPKFDAVYSALGKELAGTDYAQWSNPQGGYFINLDVKPGLAKKVVALASEAGVKLTAAGATYPGKNDPEDKNIRISPTRPPLEDVRNAAEVLALCIRLATETAS